MRKGRSIDLGGLRSYCAGSVSGVSVCAKDEAAGNPVSIRRFGLVARFARGDLVMKAPTSDQCLVSTGQGSYGA